MKPLLLFGRRQAPSKGRGLFQGARCLRITGHGYVCRLVSVSVVRYVVLDSERATPFAWFGLWLRRVNALIALFSVLVVAVM